MKTIKKIVLKNTLGITETTLEPGQINIITGKKGSGKTSVLDSINMALSNKNIRSEFIRKGENEASIHIELNDGTTIDRKKGLDTSDKITVKNENVISSPESYLKSLFSDKQFRPISFIEASIKEQNKILLGMLDIKWSMSDIESWFGEIPSGPNYEQHILNILDDIQAKNGAYYLTREEINREIKSIRSIVADSIASLPENYNADKWRAINLGELYGKLSSAQQHNANIDKQNIFLASVESQIKNEEIKNLQDNKLLKDNLNSYQDAKRAEYRALQERVKAIEKEMLDITKSVEDEKNNIEKQIAVNNTKLQSYIDSITKEREEKKATVSTKIDTEPIRAEAEYAEKMKSYLNEFDKAMSSYKTIDNMVSRSNDLTEKIEKARALPGELLKKVSSPISGISVANGVPLINGLPIQNLSTGEQLELAVEIAKNLVGELGVILVDKLECLDTESQEKFIDSCKKSGLQYFMTKVSNSEYDIIKI